MRLKIQLEEELDSIAVSQLANTLTDDTVIVCIGTDKNIGDAVGPYIGTILKESQFPFPVYGTLENPIHALNIKSAINYINKKHRDANIIAIDACIPSDVVQNMGDVIYSNKPLKPGAGVGKELGCIGNYSIKVVVADYCEEVRPYDYLNKVSLSQCRKISKNVAKLLININNTYKHN